MITLGWPQFIWLFLLFITLAFEIAKHGQPKTGSSAKHNGATTFIGFVIAFFLLYWGGFFSSNQC